MVPAYQTQLLQTVRSPIQFLPSYHMTCWLLAIMNFTFLVWHSTRTTTSHPDGEASTLPATSKYTMTTLENSCLCPTGTDILPRSMD